jgi:hypothetical protein
MAEQQQGGNITPEYNLGRLGMNMDQTNNQIQKGVVSYALNAAVENFDANSVNYQNEPGNELCVTFPTGFHLIGTHFINEKAKHVFFLVNPDTGDSEIGYMENNDCIYRTYVSAPCLNFNIDYPIHKVVHKITNCTTEIYWTDGLNPRRYLDLDHIDSVYTTKPGTRVCDNQLIPVIDCNKLKIQPNFNIPELEVVDITTGGELKAGTYQFAIQYCDSIGDGYTSYYSVTNPTPIANTQITTLNFDYPVGRSIVLNVNNIDVTGYFKYFNLAVIKTINNIASVELVGTYFIDDNSRQVTYTGQNQTQIRLSIEDIFEKFPYYEIAQDLTAVQDVLVWDNLTSIDRINYQEIASQITLQWQSYRIPADQNYSNELNATNLRGYLRDEVYAFEIVFLLKNGKQTDGFHIPGRIVQATDETPVSVTNPDFIGEPDPATNTSPYWKIYNTGVKLSDSPGKSNNSAYKGEWEYGDFAYWESTELYPCNDNVWGALANQPIRHHKFPDVLVSPIFESAVPTIVSGKYEVKMIQNDAVFPIGVKLDVSQVSQLIINSNLTDSQKADVVGFKIVRGDRSTNKSITGKGILRNVGKYNRDETDYYYPNYPYNDLREDPFILKESNAFFQGCKTYRIDVNPASPVDVEIQYLDCTTNIITTEIYAINSGTHYLCSLSFPIIINNGTTTFIGLARYNIYRITVGSIRRGAHFTYTDPRNPDAVSIVWVCAWPWACSSKDDILSLTEPIRADGAKSYDIDLLQTITPPATAPNCGDSDVGGQLEGFDDGSRYRYVFNSPETSFGQPFLGNILKLENVMFGAGKAHFVQVKKHAMYKLLTAEAQNDAIKASNGIANFTSPMNPTAMFTAYQAYLQIYINGITRKNYTYSFNSIASYDYWANVANGIGIKQRTLDLAQYLIPGVQSVGDEHNVNNWNRESSVYLRTEDHTTNPLPFPDKTPSLLSGTISLISDYSRFTISETGACLIPGNQQDIQVVAYYGSLKNLFINQWGQMYSYQTIDTGFQIDLDTYTGSSIKTVFGGDTFISGFAFKTKLPFFIDNRVNAPDDSDIFYDEIGNIAYPKYWYSGRSVLSNDIYGYGLTNFISIKAHNLDCPNSQLPAPPLVNPGRTYYDGKMYLFAYGVPNFYCESSINTNLRQAFNDREGDFWPHVNTSIPDDWVQESFVPIVQDNTYYYNVTYSKQNKENYFSHLPVDWTQDLCLTYFPFRAIYSDPQVSYSDDTVNSWLIYRPISRFDFPQNYGKLTSLDGIQNKAILARFENKSLLYNTLLTIDTSNPKAAYIGNPTLFTGAPPVDFAETDLGYVGSQHKFLLKIPQGQVTVDAKRGQIFLVGGDGAKDISAFGSGVNRFLTDHLSFEILRYFPKALVDNHFKGLGLHGVYDSKYDRVIFTKLDYIPLNKNIIYDEVERDFYLQQVINGVTVRTLVYLTDVEYFCNKSWSLSFNINTNSWVSFHSYIPNWYIAENNFFYSGINGGCDIEALAAEVLPQTTTSTTTLVFPPLPTTTSTSTTSLDCALDGNVIVNTPRPVSTTTTTSSTTSSTSTTTTTTTLCSNCDTYIITNTGICPQEVTVTSCFGETRTGIIEVDGSFVICLCEAPTLPTDVIYTYITAGCTNCFCYTLNNTTSVDQDVTYSDCNDDTQIITLISGETTYICSIYGSQIIPTGVTSTLGTTCTYNVECDPCYSTTTTTTTIL